MIKLYNSLTRRLEEFIPIDNDNVRMYVCGPTVYDRPHIGNARPAVIFDVLYRLLKYKYKKVTYIRNITDIDDKIYKASKEKHIDIKTLTDETTKLYHSDMSLLNVLPVSVEPHATEHIPEIIEFIHKIIASGYAYEANGHVYFDTGRFDKYGKLSNVNERISGARIKISENKRNNADFVLWKPSDDSFPVGWDSPWGKGRPGWHIECSAMSYKYLGEQFDIHGGGCDLIFPHHENEIAQSYSANSKIPAKYWIHNGHVTVNGTKMSKSLGNFYTVNELLAEFPGEAIRLALLMTHYRGPIDFTKNLLVEAKNILNRWYTAIKNTNNCGNDIDGKVLNALYSDLNTPMAIARLSDIVNCINRGRTELIPTFINTTRSLLGLLYVEPKKWFKTTEGLALDEEYINGEIAKRTQAKQNKNYALADEIRKKLLESGIVLEDTLTGTQWKRL